MKNMNPHKVKAFYIKKQSHLKEKEKKYLLEKNMTNFTAIFFTW